MRETICDKPGDLDEDDIAEQLLDEQLKELEAANRKTFRKKKKKKRKGSSRLNEKKRNSSMAIRLSFHPSEKKMFN